VSSDFVAHDLEHNSPKGVAARPATPLIIMKPSFCFCLADCAATDDQALEPIEIRFEKVDSA
jgi:hypothetical protein